MAMFCINPGLVNVVRKTSELNNFSKAGTGAKGLISIHFILIVALLYSINKVLKIYYSDVRNR